MALGSYPHPICLGFAREDHKFGGSALRPRTGVRADMAANCPCDLPQEEEQEKKEQ
jgi:hypothetical protein